MSTTGAKEALEQLDYLSIKRLAKELGIKDLRRKAEFLIEDILALP